jgi:hypothetical protein
MANLNNLPRRLQKVVTEPISSGYLWRNDSP